MRGVQLIAELYHCTCRPELLERSLVLAELCSSEVQAVGLHALGQSFHQFSPVGVTGTVVLAESHLNIHTWPELAAVSLDIYVCNFSADNSAKARQLYRRLVWALAPAQTNMREIERGCLTANAARD